MTDIGVKELDLYCLQKNGRWVLLIVPVLYKKMTQTIIENMKPEKRELMLYMPLYDGVASLSIGIDSLSVIGQPMIDCPVREKPVVFYGTSIKNNG